MDGVLAKVLVVDDEIAIVEELCEHLTLHGHDCVGVHSAEAAIELFTADRGFAIVLCDLQMPGLNGIELIRELDRISGDDRLFEAIIFTGQADSQSVIQALRAGVADFYQKPIDPDAVLEALQRLEASLQKRRNDFRKLGQLNRQLQDLTASISDLYQGINDRRGSVSLAPMPFGERKDDMIPAPFDQLSPRQLAVARLVARGMTNYQIACDLGISENTVKLYVSQVLRLTHMHNRTQLALAFPQPDRSDSDTLQA
jgi:DNA-binding NarL/FixJ family response regulator